MTIVKWYHSNSNSSSRPGTRCLYAFNQYYNSISFQELFSKNMCLSFCINTKLSLSLTLFNFFFYFNAIFTQLAGIYHQDLAIILIFVIILVISILMKIILVNMNSFFIIVILCIMFMIWIRQLNLWFDLRMIHMDCLYQMDLCLLPFFVLLLLGSALFITLIHAALQDIDIKWRVSENNYLWREKFKCENWQSLICIPLNNGLLFQKSSSRF